VIPVVGNSYVLVKDAKYNELTFIVGGCKLREIGKDNLFETDYSSYTKCALRELNEETRGVFQNVSSEHLVNGFKFASNNRSKKELEKDKREGVIVTMRYTVYFLPMDIRKDQFKFLRNQFHANEPTDGGETSDIVIKTKRELEKANMWRFMKDNVLHKLK
jgi:hypothetical protein